MNIQLAELEPDTWSQVHRERARKGPLFSFIQKGLYFPYLIRRLSVFFRSVLFKGQLLTSSGVKFIPVLFTEDRGSLAPL